MDNINLKVVISKNSLETNIIEGKSLQGLEKSFTKEQLEEFKETLSAIEDQLDTFIDDLEEAEVTRESAKDLYKQIDDLVHTPQDLLALKDVLHNMGFSGK